MDVSRFVYTLIRLHRSRFAHTTEAVLLTRSESIKVVSFRFGEMNDPARKADRFRSDTDQRNPRIPKCSDVFDYDRLKIYTPNIL